MLTKIIRWYFRFTKKSPDKMPMVKYWKTKAGVQAKVTKAKDGSTIMHMEGEQEPFPTFPRGHILFGHLSKIKHEIKNQVFNDSWRKLKEKVPKKQIIKDIKATLLDLRVKHDISPINGRNYTVGEDLFEPIRYDMLPPSAMSPFAREIHRAWTKVSPHTSKLRDILCFVMQEDDAYRFRVQWLAEWFGWFMKLNPVKSFDYALKMLEHGEVVSDMKERARLLHKILMLALEDRSIRKQFIALFREIDWKKVKLTKADKYHFRAKYFKVDLKYLEY